MVEGDLPCGLEGEEAASRGPFGAGSRRGNSDADRTVAGVLGLPPVKKRPAIPRLDGGLQTILLVEDVERSIEFYGESLRLEAKAGDSERYAEFETGDGGVLLLVKRDGSIAPMAATTVMSATATLTFTIQADGFAAWKKWLAKRNVPLERETLWIHGGRSLYVRDPDGRMLEFKTPPTVLPPKPAAPKRKED